MYMLKDTIAVDFANQKKVAQFLEISEGTLCIILKLKQACSKTLAMCITFMNGSKSINKYFVKIK